MSEQEDERGTESGGETTQAPDAGGGESDGEKSDDSEKSSDDGEKADE